MSQRAQFSCRRVGLALTLGLAVSMGAACAQEASRSAGVGADLTGAWTNRSLTPLERPDHQPRLVVTAAEAQRSANSVAERRASDQAPTDPNAPALPKAERPGGYNEFWLDGGERLAVVKGEMRSSGIVEPADGKIPYRDRAASTEIQRAIGQEFVTGKGDYLGPEDLPLRERCMIGFGNTGGPGMLSSAYNNTYRFVQTPSHMLILVEMVHDTRIVPISADAETARASHRPHEIAPWLGDTVGWWEGETFVMESVNIHPAQRYESSIPMSANGKVVERLTRTGADEIFYEFEVSDPEHYTKPWRAEYSFYPPKGDVFEYACHEGNYAMNNVLGGARLKERQTASAR